MIRQLRIYDNPGDRLLRCHMNPAVLKIPVEPEETLGVLLICSIGGKISSHRYRRDSAVCREGDRDRLRGVGKVGDGNNSRIDQGSQTALNDKDTFVRMSAERALRTWATQENAAYFLKMLPLMPG